MKEELNTLYTDTEKSMRSMDYEDFFGEMELTDEQKEERIELAKKFEDKFLFILSLVATLAQYEQRVDVSVLYTRFQSAYDEVIGEKYGIDDKMRQYIDRKAQELADSTIRNVEDEYFTSYDRARFISENETNAVANYEDGELALLEGKTHKTWITMHDHKVRDTHRQVNGETIPIDEYFEVGGSYMQFPMDWDADPRECVNCRCSLKYS